jgi:hypothetical protein
VSLLDQVEAIWNQLLDLLSKVILPDWSSVIGMLPLLVFLGLVGPLLTLAVLAWFVYAVRKPRPKVKLEYGARVAALDENGQPVYPTAEPFCPVDRLIYPSGAERCDICGNPLSVTCPRCGLTRLASIEACGNCGLVIRVEPKAIVAPPAGPRPGGAAVA